MPTSSQNLLEDISNYNTLSNKTKRRNEKPTSTLKFINLSLILLGLQFAWSLELTYGTPYLLSLGISKPAMFLVWLAGPLSGLIMQPVIGVLSDNCTSNLGRRRPFLLVGGMFSVFSLILIGWTLEIVESIGLNISSARLLAVVAFYLLDFSINTIQAASRALIVDVLPIEEQETGNAWAARMIGLGTVIGNFTGYLDLVELFPILGTKQLQILSFFAIFLLLLTLAITCLTIKENPFRKNPSQDSEGNDESFVGESRLLFLNFYNVVLNLPKPVVDLCKVQCFAWIGWFTFLFTSSSWVAEFLPKSPHSNSTMSIWVTLLKGEDKVGDETRIGARALVIYSIVSLIASVLLPYFSKNRRVEYATTNIHRWFPTLPQYFTFSLLLFSILMYLTKFITTVSGATFIIASCGVCWAITMWAPFSIVGEAAREMEDKADASPSYDHHIIPTSSSSLLAHYEESDDVKESENSAGLLLGIHNTAIVLPQFLSAFMSSLIYEFLGKDTSFGVAMRLGAFASLIAAYLSLRLWKVEL